MPTKPNPSASADDNSIDHTHATPEQLADQAKSKLTDMSYEAKAKLTDMSHEATAALGRVTDQVEDLARRTLERARETSGQVRERIGRAGDATVGYIKDEPVKAVMIAAATGAVTALVLSWLARSRRN